MTASADKVSLEPTAALVIDLARKFYNEDALTRKFIEHLDIASGQKMIEGYKQAAIYELTQELIFNRKFIIREATLQAVNEAAGMTQVLILAAGKAPLALELLTRQSDKIAQIYEVDIASLEQKQSLYRMLAPQFSRKISILQSDICSSALLKDLEHRGFNSTLYTIIILEGITHYMAFPQLEKTLRSFASPDHSMRRIIIDFGPPYETLAERIRPIAIEAYRIIEENCYLQRMTKYTAQDLTTLLHNIGGEVLHGYTICDIEKMRTGHNACFPEKNSGWLEYMVAHI